MDAIGWMFPPEAPFTRPKGGPDRIEQVFYSDPMAKEQLFELARRTFDTPEFRGIECIEVEAKRSEEHKSELQSPDTISYAVFCLKKEKKKIKKNETMSTLKKKNKIRKKNRW